MRSSNPVLTRLTPETFSGYQAAVDQAVPTYPSTAVPAETERMTIDDVVVRTVGLLALLGASGALAWQFVPDRLLVPIWIGAAVAGLVLGLVIAFARVTNPVPIVAYAAVEGVFLGLVSKYFHLLYPGIVSTAVVSAFGLFLLMAALYKARVIRATPRFARMVTAAVVGVIALMLVNFLLSLFGLSLYIRDGGPIAIVFSLVVIAIASLTFVLDFAAIEEGVAAGMPKRYAWACAFGIVVGLVWLYLEILRLLSYLRGEE